MYFKAIERITTARYWTLTKSNIPAASAAVYLVFVFGMQRAKQHSQQSVCGSRFKRLHAKASATRQAAAHTNLLVTPSW